MCTIVASHVPTKNTNHVWVVFIEGQEESRQYCKSAYKAMRFMFLLKARTEGARIQDESLKALSQSIKEQKALEHPEYAENAAKIQEVAVEIAVAHDVNRILEEKPKPKAQSAEVSTMVLEDKPAPKKRGRKPKAKAE